MGEDEGQDLALERWNIDFSVSKSIRYHAYRRSFWDTWGNITNVLTIVSGTSVLISLVGKAPSVALALSIVVALTSAADIVLRFSQKARDHDGLYRGFSRLAQDIAEVDHPTTATLAAWRRRRLEIEMDEPFIIDLLERRCAGEEARSRGSMVRPAWNLSRWQVALSQFIPLPANQRDEAPEPS